MSSAVTAHYHLPGLFEFREFYKIFLPLFFEHRDWFYDWCDIGSIYGSPGDCIWGGGRIENAGGEMGLKETREILFLLKKYGVSARLAFSNSLLKEEHLADKKCNELCALFSKGTEGSNAGTVQNGVIVHSDLLLEYLKKNFPNLYFVSSTTKVLTDFDDFTAELNRPDFKYVVPDFRLNRKFEGLEKLSQPQKDKTEFLCNECCWTGCTDRKACYQTVSRQILGENCSHTCRAPGGNKGYRFSSAIQNPSFISVGDILSTYMPLGFSNFKIEGRSLGSALLLEFILHYMTKSEFHINLREEMYLDNSLDLF